MSGWPRLMKKVTAARYLDISPDTFDTLPLPQPISVRGDGKLRLYDRNTLDAWIDKLSGQPLADTPENAFDEWKRERDKHRSKGAA
jgi:hypothetical protein